MSTWDEYVATHGYPSRKKAMEFVQEEHPFANDAARYLLARSASPIELEELVVASEALGEDAWLRLRKIADKRVLMRVIRRLGVLSYDPPPVVLDAWYRFLEQDPTLEEIIYILEDAECLEGMVLHEMMRRKIDWSLVDDAVLPEWFRSFVQRRRTWEAAEAAKKAILRDVSKE